MFNVNFEEHTKEENVLPHFIFIPLPVKKKCRLQSTGSEGGGTDRGSVAASTLSSQPKDN